MKRLLPSLLLLALLVALLAADDALLERQRAARDEGVRVGRFLPKAEGDALLVAAVTLRAGDGRQWVYGRIGGLWRCLDLHQAPVREADVQALLDGVRDGEGTLHSRDPARAADYGFGTERAWTVSFHGPGLMSAPDKDVRLAVEVGDRVPGLQGCYLRRLGQDAVWAVDRDLHEQLDAGGPAPLLDPHLLPSGWPPSREPIRRVQVQREDGVAYAIEARASEPPPGAPPGTEGGVRWVLVDGSGGEQPLGHILGISYLSFLGVAAWEEIVDPAELPALGLEHPAARLVLQAGISSLSLLASGPDAQGRRVLVNPELKCAYRVSADVFTLLVPDKEQLLFAPVNPWEAWLK